MNCVCRSSVESDEVVLCALKVDCNGVLSVKPDFNKGRRAYKVGGGIDGRGMSLCVSVLVLLLAG